jgi:chemosensory pili system protein ChpA (sensor histidine kinase/response regulator)
MSSSNSNVDINEVLRQLRAGGNMPEELVEIFSEEAEEHMRTIYDGLDRLRVDPNDKPALGDVRRSSHTLKGAAGAVGFEAITRLSHRMEDLLDWLADHNQGPNETQLQLLLVTADQIEDITTTEVDFDETAKSLITIYGQYEVAMAALAETPEGVTTVEATPAAAETAAPATATKAPETKSSDTIVDTKSEKKKTVQLAPHLLIEIKEELRTGSKINVDLAEIFAEESEEHLTAIRDGLDRLNKNNADTAAMADIRRSSHTLKGASGAVGMMSMHRLAYRIEVFLDALSDNARTPSADQVQLLADSAENLFFLSLGDFDIEDTATSLADIYGRFEAEMSETTQSETEDALEQNTVDADIDSADSASKESPANKTQKQKSGSSQATQYLRVPLDRLDSLVSLVGEMIVNRSSFSQRLTDFAERIEEMNSSLNRLRNVASDFETRSSIEALNAGKTRQSRGFGANRIKAALGNEATEGLDSLEFDTYSDLHLLAQSLSEATNDIGVISSELKNIHGDFDSLVNRQQRFNRDAQSSLMHVRMVPVDNISNRLERTVRTVSNKLGKKINLSITGGNTELDKTVLEEITDPLLHLIRNAMDHGIETPEIRAENGKAEQSELRIEALNQGTRVTIRVVDDGRGLDAGKIKRKAIERGLITEDKTLSTEEIHSLIFMPGFSTAESLTDVSGRGVGMDVVREAVQRLKGTIQVESVAGQGSTFTIHLPTTLAVANALMVNSSGHQFAIPMQSVQQILRLDPNTVTKAGAHPMINLGDRMLLLKDLANHMELRADKESFEVAKAVLLIRTGDDEVAITIDGIDGGQDIVVKTLGDHLRNVPGYLGATVSGDGTVIPILDPADLCGQVQSSTSTNYMRRSQDLTPKVRRKTAMVIDDSLSVRRVTTNLLRSFGWDVIDAKDGVDALEQLAVADTPPDIFLCDMEMPRMDGLELVSRIRSQTEFLTTPVVMVTSRSGEKHRRLAREAGADEHVVKPFNDEGLMSLVERMVAEHRELVGA